MLSHLHPLPGRARADLPLLPRLLLLVGCLSLGSSCSVLTAPAVVRGPAELNSVRTAEDVAAQTTLESDSFKGTTFISGPTFHVKDDVFGVRWHLWTRPGDDLCYLSLTDLRDDWAFFDHAADSNGRRFDVVQQDQSVYAHMVQEQLYLSFPVTYLKAHAGSGTTIKIWGLRGEEVFDVPGFYIAGFLQAAASVAK